MNPVLLLSLLAQYGPGIIDVVQKLMADISAGRKQTTVTPDDLAELKRLSGLSSASIYASLGIKLPEATT